MSNYPVRVFTADERDALVATGYVAQTREQFGVTYWYMVPVDYAHTHTNACIGVCTVPDACVVGSEVDPTVVGD